MSDESLGMSSSTLQHQNSEDKVQSVKNLIQNLKSQIEQERQLRLEESQLLNEQKEKNEQSESKINQLSELAQRQSAEIEQLEYKNDTLQRKVEELLIQVKEKPKNGGGIFGGIFNGKQKLMMEQLESSLSKCEEELQIKTEETERIHEHLYDLKKELNLKIDELNESIEQYKQINEQQIQLVKKHEQKEVDYKKSIDGLHNAKKIIEKELENSIKDLQNIKVQYSSDASSFKRVISIQKELLDIEIPSFKKQTQSYDNIYDSLAEDKTQQTITQKEKEREVFKTFNNQRENLKKQFGNIFNIFEQKINTIISNIESCQINSANPQSDQYVRYNEAASSFLPKILGMKEGFNNVFTSLDKIISLEFQISTAKQQSQTIEQIELLEKQDSQKITLLEKLEESKNIVAVFLSEIQLYLNEEMTLFTSIPSSLLQTYQDINNSFKDIQLIYEYYLQTLQSQVVFNVRDAQQFSYLRDNYKSKANAKEELIQISTKFFNKLNTLITQLKKKAVSENEIIEQFIAYSDSKSKQSKDGEMNSPTRPAVTYKFHLISPNALYNENLTLITSLNAFKVTAIEMQDLFFHFLVDFNFKENFVSEQFKSIDLIRVVDEYLRKINKTTDIHCILSNQRQIKEMSDKIADQSEQINSLHEAIDTQNQNISELTSNKSKAEEQLTNKIKIMEEIKELVTKQMKNENELVPSLENILNLLDHEKGYIQYQKNLRVSELTLSKARIQDKINQEKFLKEVVSNLTPIEKILTEDKQNQESERKAISIFEKSREKLISLLAQNNQLEKRAKDVSTRLEEKELKIKKQQSEINEQKTQIDRLKITSTTSSSSTHNDNQNNTTSATANNLIDLL